VPARCWSMPDAVSCLMFAVQAEGADVVTIEGIGPA
jgi:aerobic-type carbon monoxide dehydrogenase small subunit (CoxS/CutS family)